MRLAEVVLFTRYLKYHKLGCLRLSFAVYKGKAFFFHCKINHEQKEVEGIEIATKSERLHQPLNKELQKLQLERR